MIYSKLSKCTIYTPVHRWIPLKRAVSAGTGRRTGSASTVAKFFVADMSTGFFSTVARIRIWLKSGSGVLCLKRRSLLEFSWINILDNFKIMISLLLKYRSGSGLLANPRSKPLPLNHGFGSECFGRIRFLNWGRIWIRFQNTVGSSFFKVKFQLKIY